MRGDFEGLIVSAAAIKSKLNAWFKKDHWLYARGDWRFFKRKWVFFQKEVARRDSKEAMRDMQKWEAKDPELRDWLLGKKMRASAVAAAMFRQLTGRKKGVK